MTIAKDDLAVPTGEPHTDFTVRPTLAGVNLPTLPLGSIVRLCAPAILRNLNKTTTVWSALAVATVTAWNAPGLKEQIAALITAPSLGNLSTLIGVLLFVLLLYFTKPVGVP